jgi:hypothetical protein
MGCRSILVLNVQFGAWKVDSSYWPDTTIGAQNASLKGSLHVLNGRLSVNVKCALSLVCSRSTKQFSAQRREKHERILQQGTD